MNILNKLITIQCNYDTFFKTSVKMINTWDVKYLIPMNVSQIKTGLSFSIFLNLFML